MFKNVAYPIVITRNKDSVYDLLKVLTGTLFIALMAQVSIPLPFTPVPVTGQTFAVLLIAALMSPKKAVASVLNYILLGVIGAPAFALGSAGSAVLMGPTAGYLLGFVLSALLVSYLIQHFKPVSLFKIALCMWMGSLVVFTLGFAVLSLFVGSKNAFTMGVIPFVPGDFIKIFLAAVSYKLIKKI